MVEAVGGGRTAGGAGAVRVAVMVLAAMLPAAQLAAEGVEARTDHFRVVTLAPAEAASAAATVLERTRGQLIALGFTLTPSVTEVAVFRDQAEMQVVMPPPSRGFFQQGADASFLGVAWSGGGDPLEALAHELAHQALLPVTGGQPVWLREGLAELLSNLKPAPGGLRLGAPIEHHVSELKRNPPPQWYSPPFRSDSWFYPQSWRLAHWLVVGKAFAGNLAQRIADLRPATPPPGWQPGDQVLSEILPVNTTAEAPAEPKVRALEPWDYEHRLAELMRAMNRAEHVRETLMALRARHPDRPEPCESLGALEMDALHYDAAERWLGEAVRLGSANASTHYRYSLLLMQPGKPAADAARHAQRAVDLDSKRPLYWLARAQAEMQLARWEAARESLEQMRRRTAEPLLVEQVRVELAEVERRREQELRPPLEPKPPERRPAASAQPEPVAASLSSPVAPPPSPALTSWPPPGTLLFSGRLQGVECTGQGKILTLTNRLFLVRVREQPGAPAKLYYAPRNMHSVPCSLKNVRLHVVYRPMADFGPLNGDVVAVLF